MQKDMIAEEETPQEIRQASMLHLLFSTVRDMVARVRTWRLRIERTAQAVAQHVEVFLALYRKRESLLAHLAFDVLNEGDGIQSVLREHYGIAATADNIEAFWLVLRQPAWRTVPSEKLKRYLHVATYRQAERIKRDQEMAERGRRSGQRLDRCEWEARTRSRSRTTHTDPLRDLIVREEAERTERDVVRIFSLELLRPVERRILELHIGGCSTAEALRRVGANWAIWQALQRKVLRRLGRRT